MGDFFTAIKFHTIKSTFCCCNFGATHSQLLWKISPLNNISMQRIMVLLLKMKKKWKPNSTTILSTIIQIYWKHRRWLFCHLENSLSFLYQYRTVLFCNSHSQNKLQHCYESNCKCCLQKYIKWTWGFRCRSFGFFEFIWLYFNAIFTTNNASIRLNEMWDWKSWYFFMLADH